MNWSLFADEITDWITNLQDSGGGFHFWREGNVTLKGTAFAVFTLSLLGRLEEYPYRQQVAEFLLSHQQKETGDFEDNLPLQAHPPFSTQYIQDQINMFVLDALRLLNTKPRYPLVRLKKELEELDPAAFLNELDWSNSWYASNPVMFKLAFSDHLASWLGPDENMENAHRWLLAALLTKQDNVTGFWGPDNGADMYNSLYGSFHFLSYYLYRGLKLSGLPAMGRRTLKLQSSEGFFVLSPGGGACEDFDGIDLMIKSVHRDGLTEPVRNSLKRAATAVMDSRNEDGGFPWARTRNEISFKNIVFPLCNLNRAGGFVPGLRLIARNWLQLCCGSRNWHYSGLDFISIPYSESDLWSTYFRVLGLAAIDRIDPLFEKSDWQFRDFPGMGWQEKA
jgi:hypothetical protein